VKNQDFLFEIYRELIYYVLRLTFYVFFFLAVTFIMLKNKMKIVLKRLTS